VKCPLELHWFGKLQHGFTLPCLVIAPFAYVWHPNLIYYSYDIEKAKKSEFRRINVGHISAAHNGHY
jgi:hypothetical protein